MSKRMFRLLAEMLRAIPDRKARLRQCQAIIDECETVYPRFDPQTFREAARCVVLNAPCRPGCRQKVRETSNPPRVKR